MTSDASDDVPLAAKQMYALGPRTEAAVKELFRSPQRSLFPDETASPTLAKEGYEFLAQALMTPRWSDDEAEKLVRSIAARSVSSEALDVSLVSRWVLAHPNDAASVILCMDVEPPSDIEIRKVLSQVGSQKVVFQASWHVTLREVVVKKLLFPETTVRRELEAFPLNLSHPNIIKTYSLHNTKGEVFLIEELLGEVLYDSWRAAGVQEAANLLYDIGAGIKYLHEHDRVHGDIKPDNIGRRHGDFILLDFGICRPTAEFSIDASATGSLRTRAPELLLTDTYPEPAKVDVWALGATVFASLTDRFPLLNPGERVPRLTDTAARQQFEVELARRVRNEWNTWVDLKKVPAELRPILRKLLEQDPSKRISSSVLLKEIEATLPALIRGAVEKAQRDGRFSPLEELSQIEEYLKSIAWRTPLPVRKRSRLRERLKEIEQTHGFSAEDRERAVSLQHVLSEL